MFGDPGLQVVESLTISFINTYSFKEYSQIKDKKNNTIGMKMSITLKTDLATDETLILNFTFEMSIDDDGSWLKVMKDHKLVKQGGSWYTMENHKGKEIKFQSILRNNSKMRSLGLIVINSFVTK